MPEHRKYCTEDFVLKEVMRRPPAFIYLAALAGFILAALIYIFIVRALFYRGGLPLAFGIMILFMTLILKTQSKTIIIYLDKKSIFMDGTRYLRRDIDRIDTYAYDQYKRTRIYFRIRFTNGRRIYITDTQLFERRDEAKAELLKKLLNALKKRLEIELIQQPKPNGQATYVVKTYQDLQDL